jgi:hypothetical protein
MNLDAIAAYRHSLSERFARAAHYVVCLKDGLLHMQDAPLKVQKDYARDRGTCAIESALALSEDIAPEITLMVAATEAAEKIAHGTGDHVDYRAIVHDTVVSLLSSHAAAMQAGSAMIHDLEMAGTLWEHKHSAPHFS